ncbi:SGNH/GDSL hydrolase family protein [Mucilaginibacter segetis]|uniref:SGNH/GDSL hydrolase family protein n=1 Tax=Mucilaginibacter segetis TaxID=2793071 RepID=A0A934PR74_9SPHI|nr:SGNH/GDSL hydrolase family protein [Mucilaginibacter segetis]MBK0377955.1 SGNH/GDSL hydrolase family protein [Mucilaginibacter segetis]
MKNILILLIFTVLSAGCNRQLHHNNKQTMPGKAPLTYLALGDSYTIGESVPGNESFPYQLVSTLTTDGYSFNKPEIIAVTGWTTDELINAIQNSTVNNKKFDIVTLLIGVNNQYRGYKEEIYRKEFIQLLHTAITFADGKNKRVFVLSIPDWGATPFAEGRDRQQIADEVARFNAINLEESKRANVNYIDITPISKRAAADASLTAEDGLHPSGEMYNLWVKELAPVVISQLK